MFEIRKDIFADERDDDLNEIGKPTQRQDMLGHVTGRSPFYDDHQFEGLLHLRCLRSPHHHARIRSLDVSQAERADGVQRVITAKDVPVNLNTLLSLLEFGKDDEPSLAHEMVRYVGEPIVAVVADSERQAYEAIDKIRIDYEVVPHVLDVEEAIQPGAVSVNATYPENYFEYHEKYDHQKLRFGDVEAALREADHVIEGRYQMSPIEQAPVEPNGAIAAPETNDRYVCYTATQGLFFSLGTSAKILNVQSNRLHFIGGTVGGGFGGKVDSLNEPLAILGCMLTGRPVRYGFNRYEEMQVGAPRGAEVWYLTDGVMNDGRIVARKLRGYFDFGAYTRLSSYAVIKGTGHMPGPYTIPNVSSNIYGVYTNRTPATAMRGFGITGVDFAIETHMDKVATQLDIDPIELRLINAYRDGDMKAHRREAKNCALIECVQVAAEKSNWSIGEEFKQMSSLVGGGTAERAAIPHTVTDEDGRIGGPRSAPPPPPRATPPASQPAASQSAPTPPATTQPAATQPATTPPPPASSRQAPRPGVHRFSSIFGPRRN